MKTEQCELAKNDFDTAIRLGTEFETKAMNEYTIDLENQGQNPLIQRTLKKAIQELSSFYCNRGKCYHKLDNPKAAILDFNESIKKSEKLKNLKLLSKKDNKLADPKLHEYYSNRALVFLHAGYYGKAIEDYTECINALGLMKKDKKT